MRKNYSYLSRIVPSDDEISVDSVDSLYYCPKITLSWSNISCVTSTKRFCFFKGQSEKQILRNVHGIAYPGRLLALMGASGAGKTTLLNILTYQTTELRNLLIGGQVKANGFEVNEDIRFVSAYVEQNQSFHGYLTVREHLTFCAALKLGRNYCRDSQNKRVNYLLDEFGLAKCAEQRILDEAVQGISGSERKLLAIAAELMENRSIIFCDEPTTGLDISMATTVVSILKNLTQKVNLTVICTIHQPSSNIFHMFDDVSLLSEGRLIFHGEIDQSKQFFAEYLKNPCPKNYNPADHYIKSLAIIPGQEEFSLKRIAMADSAFCSSHYFQDLQELVQQDDDFTNKGGARLLDIISVDQIKNFEAPWIKQVMEVTRKQLNNQFRNPRFITFFLCQCLLNSALISMVYFNQSYDQKGVMNLNAGSYLTISMILNLAVTQSSSLSSELKVFYKDLEKGLYTTSAFFISRNVSEFIFSFPMLFLVTTPIYWSIGLRQDFRAYIIALLTYNLSYHCALSFMVYLAVILFENLTSALTIMPLFRTFMSMVAGFYANEGAMNLQFLHYLQYVSYSWYAFRLLIYNQWAYVDEIVCETENHACFTDGASVIYFYNFDYTDIKTDLLTLLGFTILFRLLAFLVLLIKTKRQTIQRIHQLV